MKNIFSYIIMVSLLVQMSCSNSDSDSKYTDDPGQGAGQSGNYNESKTVAWNFENINDWVHANQGDNANIEQAFIESGNLKIFTQARTKERKKIRTKQAFGAGRYTWRVYVSDLGEGDRCSIGAWLYNDDEHEIDFEIGSGLAKEREEMELASDEVIAYMTTQANPHRHMKVRVKKNAWHTFELDLSLVGENYLVKWIIDDMPAALVQQTYGEEFPFFIFCSVENLSFVGDHWPTKNNYALYEYVKYTPYDYAMEPVIKEGPVSPTEPGPTPGTDDTVIWDFNDLTGWKYSSDIGADAAAFVKIEEGILNLTIDPTKLNRNNLESEKSYSTGKYEWKVIIPEMEKNARFNTGGMLYTADESAGYHALGMSVMYGSTGNRTDFAIPDNKLVLRLSSDEAPTFEVYKAIEPGEYLFAIELSEVDGKYKAVWMLDNEVLLTKDMQFGVETEFKIICAAAQLRWWGDNDMTKPNTGKFDYVKYTSFAND